METTYVDGAHQGISPEAAMSLAINGGELPKREMTPELMEAYLLSAWVAPAPEDGASGYDWGAARLGGFLLRTIRAHPEIAAAPVSGRYGFPDGTIESMIVEVKGWAELLKEEDPEGWHAVVDGVTGFQFGWACNAVRYVLGLGAVSNPAIIEIEVDW